METTPKPPKPPRPKKTKEPSIGEEPIKRNQEVFWSASSSLPFSLSPCLYKDKDIEMEEMEEVKEIAKLVLKQGRKRKGALVTPEKEKKNWEPEIRVIQPLPRPIEASIPSLPPSPI